MEIERDYYLNALIRNMNNHFIKVVTGIRGSGKTYLVNKIFREYLYSIGVSQSHIIYIDIESQDDSFISNATNIYNYVMDRVKDKDVYYVFIEEIERVKDFEKVLNGFLDEWNLQVFVIASDAKGIAKDIITEFRGRSKEINIMPLSYKEFSEYKGINNEETISEYMTYGGLIEVVLEGNTQKKEKILESYYYSYLENIKKQYRLKRMDALDKIIRLLASSLGAFTDPLELVNKYKSDENKPLSINTVNNYLDCLNNSFILSKSNRYKVKWKRKEKGECKYYFTDLGIRNYLTSFINKDTQAKLENLVYNEMKRRWFDIYTGIVEKKVNGKRKYEVIDFICRNANNKYYIQLSSYTDLSIKESDYKPLLMTHDFYKKILIDPNPIWPGYNEKGILVLNIKDFLTNESIIDL